MKQRQLQRTYGFPSIAGGGAGWIEQSRTINSRCQKDVADHVRPITRLPPTLSGEPIDGTNEGCSGAAVPALDLAENGDLGIGERKRCGGHMQRRRRSGEQGVAAAKSSRACRRRVVAASLGRQ